MARRKRKILRIAGWVLLGFISFISLTSLVFYLSRGWVKERALAYLNEMQPGYVNMGKINLIPFMDFPRAAIQLKNVRYYESARLKDSLPADPILSMNEIFVSLDVIDLIRGDLIVTRAKLEEGNIGIVVYEDSVTNLERALGIRFGEKDDRGGNQGLPSLRIDLDRLQLTGIQLEMQDRTGGSYVDLMISDLESQFSYLPRLVRTAVELDMEINSFRHLSLSSETNRKLRFDSQISYDVPFRKITIHPSSLALSDLMLEVWGSYDLMDDPFLDLGFRATSEGLDVLNFLLRGVLDMEEIEQIGAGTINLEGSLSGDPAKGLPLIRATGTASQVGFRIKSLRQDVTGISFRASASTGNLSDLSEAVLQVENFRANFPEGFITGRFTAQNMLLPQVDMEVHADVEVTGLEQMIAWDAVSDLAGHVKLDGRFSGLLDRTGDDFLNEAGDFTARLADLGFVYRGDTVEKASGELYLMGNVVGARRMDLQVNGNRILLEAEAENLMHAMLGFQRDVRAEVTLSSDRINPSALLGDTSLAGVLGEEIRDLHFSAGAVISKPELDRFLRQDSLPRFLFSLDSFGVRLPVYAEISDLRASMKFGPDTLDIDYLGGRIGRSGFGFSGTVVNHTAIGRKDSAAVVSLSYDLSSGFLEAEEIFTFREKFLLPEIYRKESLEHVRLAGSARMPVSVLLDDGASPDFELDIKELGCSFGTIPLALDQFVVKIRKESHRVTVEDFRGRVGENNLVMRASLEHVTDSLQEMTGNIFLESELLDFNQLMYFNRTKAQGDPEGMTDTVKDSSQSGQPLRLDRLQYPQINVVMDLGEIRLADYRIMGVKGVLRSTKEKILYMDSLVVFPESGGQIALDGQFNVSGPHFYTFSTALDLKKVNLNDLDFEMTWGEESYTLKENFAGLITAKGLAEIFITPDLTFDISTSTAIFDVALTDGALINFTPLQAAAKYLDNKDLNDVRFASLRNRFTLVDSRIMIPLMSVGSTIGQLLIEGEQGLDNSYLYLVRIPTWLVRDAARSMLIQRGRDQDQDQIHEMQMGKFLVLTAWSDGVASEIKTGDRRDRYQ
ncbi:MAG TPA: hypothetical protein ENO05_12495 [Bacteroides sp.]|nr:hypothetical protein [Bacteroides sp.]